MSNYLSNVDVIEANNRITNIKFKDASTLALAQSNANRISNLEALSNKRILIIGDSISDENRGDNWVTSLRTKYPTAEITNDSLSGRWLTQIPSILATYNPDDYDFVIIFAGINDWINGVNIGSWGTGSDYTSALRAVCSTLQAKSCESYFITSLCTTRTGLYPLNMYRSIMVEACKYWGIHWINGAAFPHIGGNVDNTYMSDGLHPDSNYADIMCDYIVSKIQSGGDNNDCDNIPYNIEIPETAFTSAVSNITKRQMYFINGQLHFLVNANIAFSNNFYTEVMLPPFDNIFNMLNINRNQGRFNCVLTQNNEIIPASAWVYNNNIIVQHGSGKTGTGEMILDIALNLKSVYI